MKGFEGKIIICGDCNSTQYSKAYRALKKERQDTFLKKGFGLGTTYNLLGYPLRLDYVLVDKGFDILSHENFKLGYSDHEPIMTRLKLN